MICQGCQQGLPCLDPQVDVPAIQSVGPQTSREEIRDIYHQVNKLRRLPGSLLCGPEWTSELTRDVVVSMQNCLRWTGGKQLRGGEESELADTHLM